MPLALQPSASQHRSEPFNGDLTPCEVPQGIFIDPKHVIVACTVSPVKNLLVNLLELLPLLCLSLPFFSLFLYLFLLIIFI